MIVSDAGKAKRPIIFRQRLFDNTRARWSVQQQRVISFVHRVKKRVREDHLDN